MYLSTDFVLRKQQLRFLSSRRSGWGNSCVVAGDFNDIVGNHEKGGEMARRVEFQGV